MRPTTLSLLVAHLAAAASAHAQAGAAAVRAPAFAPSPTPTPRPALVAPSQALAAAGAPQPTPARLDFPPLFDGDTKTLTVRITSPGAGYVTGALSDPNFRLTEVRAMGSGYQTSGQAGNALAMRTVAARSTAAPWQVNVPAGALVEFDVRFAPKFALDNAAGAKAAKLALTGPGVSTPWRADVPLAGRFEGIRLALVFKADGDAFDVVEPATRLEVPVTILAFGHDTPGVFRVRKAPAGFVVEEKSFVAKAGAAAKTTLAIRLDGVWLGRGSYRPGGEVRVAFEHEGKSSEATFTVVPWPGMLEIRTGSVGAADRPGCDAMGIRGLVRLSSDGAISVGMWWEPATSWKSDATTSLFVRALVDGRAYAEGLYPKTRQSAYYGIPGPLFRTTFAKKDYLPMYKRFGNGAFAFSCASVPASNHF